MSILFRPAQPDDVDTAIALMYLSGPNAFHYVFNTAKHGSALDFLRSAYLDGAGEFGYRNHLVGTHNGQVVAIGGGWSAKQGLAFMLAGARQILTQYGLIQGVKVMLRGLRTEVVIPPPSKGQFYLGHLCVTPGMQGLGIGQLLLQELLQQGKAQGFHLATLDVAATNPRAQAMYERYGFTVTRERASTLKNQYGFVANHRHMQMNIPT